MEFIGQVLLGVGIFVSVVSLPFIFALWVWLLLEGWEQLETKVARWERDRK